MVIDLAGDLAGDLAVSMCDLRFLIREIDLSDPPCGHQMTCGHWTLDLVPINFSITLTYGQWTLDIGPCGLRFFLETGAGLCD